MSVRTIFRFGFLMLLLVECISVAFGNPQFPGYTNNVDAEEKATEIGEQIFNFLMVAGPIVFVSVAVWIGTLWPVNPDKAKTILVALGVGVFIFIVGQGVLYNVITA